MAKSNVLLVHLTSVPLNFVVNSVHTNKILCLLRNLIEQTLEVNDFNPNPDFSPKIAALHLITAPTHQLQLLAKCALCKYSSAKELKDNTYLKSTLVKSLKGFWIKNQALFHPFSHNLSKSEKNSLEYLIRSSQGNLLHYIILQMNYSKN